MEMTDVLTVAVLAGIASALVQLFKDFLKSEKDIDGHEVGKRRFLPFIVLILTTVTGSLWGYFRGENIFIWGVMGLMAGFTSMGYYNTAKTVLPSAVNSKGWLNVRR